MHGSSVMTFITHRSSRLATPAADPRLVMAVRRVLWLGVTLVLAVPAARGYNAWFGWMPLWLLGMPLAALWSLHRFQMPGLPSRRTKVRTRQRRAGAQARRRPQRGAQRNASAA